jgi:hypothetical protein
MFDHRNGIITPKKTCATQARNTKEVRGYKSVADAAYTLEALNALNIVVIKRYEDSKLPQKVERMGALYMNLTPGNVGKESKPSSPSPYGC